MIRLLQALLLSLVLISSYAQSSTVSKVKGQAVLINTDGENLKVGAYYYLVSGGKKKGIVKIAKIRPGQALAKLLKGAARPSWSLVERKKITRQAKAPAPSAPTETKPIYAKKRKKSSSPESKLAAGLVLGYGMNSSKISYANNPQKSSLSGSSTSFGLLLDYKFKPRIGFHAELGMHNFFANDSADKRCVDSSGSLDVCSVDLGYINLDLWAKYYFVKGRRYSLWLGGGAGILFSPQYNDTTAIKEADLATTTLIQAGVGLELMLGKSFFIPFWLEYGLYPPSDTVTMNSISAYAGFALKL